MKKRYFEHGHGFNRRELVEALESALDKLEDYYSRLSDEEIHAIYEAAKCAEENY